MKHAAETKQKPDATDSKFEFRPNSGIVGIARSRIFQLRSQVHSLTPTHFQAHLNGGLFFFFYCFGSIVDELHRVKFWKWENLKSGGDSTRPDQRSTGLDLMDSRFIQSPSKSGLLSLNASHCLLTRWTHQRNPKIQKKHRWARRANRDLNTILDFCCCCCCGRDE